MKIIADKHTVTINKNEIVNEGEYNVQACNFEFSPEYDGLPKIAIFKTETVTKQILLSGDSCITPSEVLETTGIVGLGVYAYENDGDNLILRYSPTPAVFTVEPGSYDEGDTPTPPSPSIVEQLQAQITENANNISLLQDVTNTHTTQIETLQTDVNNIKAEQITQNQNIQANANDISNIKQEQETQNQNISQNASNIDELQNIVDQLPHETGEGTDIELEPTIEAKMSIGEFGSSSQFSTDGKNLLNLGNIRGQNNGVLYTVNNGKLNLDGACTGDRVTIDLPIQSNLNGTYTFSTNYLKPTAIKKSGGTNLFLTNTSSGEITATINDTPSQLVIYGITGITFNSLDIELQIESGSTATSYEPYTDGPAPNPSYPYPVNSVTGENSLVIQNENLFDKSNYEYLDNANVSSSSVINIENNFALIYVKLQAGTYTISNDIGSYQWLISDCNEIPAIGTSTSPRQVTTDTSVTYTMNSIGYLLIRVAKNSFSISDFVNKLQIVKGSTAPSTYVEHEEQNYQLSLGNIELNSSPDGTIRDLIVGSPDNWFKREYIGKKTFTGDENWTYDFNLCIRLLDSDVKGTTDVLTEPNVFSNFFKGETQQELQNGTVDYGIGIRTIGYEGFIIRDKDFTTLNQYKRYLKTQYDNNTPVIAWYEKAQYADIPITDTTLINQLNTIYENAHSYKGTTNITSTYEDGNEQMYLDASALTDIAKKIDTLTNAILELGGE